MLYKELHKTFINYVQNNSQNYYCLLNKWSQKDLCRLSLCPLNNNLKNHIVSEYQRNKLCVTE